MDWIPRFSSKKVVLWVCEVWTWVER